MWMVATEMRKSRGTKMLRLDMELGMGAICNLSTQDPETGRLLQV